MISRTAANEVGDPSRDLPALGIPHFVLPNPERMRPSSRLRPGEVFMAPSGTEIAIVEAGSLTLEITMLNGAELSVHQIGVGEAVVPLESLATPAFAPCYRADVATRIRWSRQSPTAQGRMFDADRSIARSRDRLLAACIRLIHELACLPTPHRLYCELLRMANLQQGGGQPVLHLPTQAELALRLCTTRESISREISFLRREGVLSDGKSPRLLNRNFLLSRIAGALNLSSEAEVWASIGARTPLPLPEEGSSLSSSF